MNNKELKRQIASVLKIKTNADGTIKDNQRWSDAEIQVAINESLKQISMETDITTKTCYPRVKSTDGNSFLLPSDTLKIKGVSYRGKPLDRKDTKYLDERYSGTFHYRELRGEGRIYTGQDWRKVVGDPVHWFFEDSCIKCCPIPRIVSSDVANREPITRINVGINLGSDILELHRVLPSRDTSFVNLYMNGVLMDNRSYEIISSEDYPPYDCIHLFFYPDYTGVASVEYFPDYVTAYKTTFSVDSEFKATILVSSIPDAEVNNNSGFKVIQNGITLRENVDYRAKFISEPANDRIEIVMLNQEVIGSNNFELIIYNIANLNPRVGDSIGLEQADLRLEYVYSPHGLSELSDEPYEIPAQFHDAIWKYSVFLCLSMEGQQTQDFEKGIFYRNLYQEVLSKMKTFSSNPVDIDFRVLQPFFV